ncbi:MAG: OmpA family protein [Candidatus Competibacteraceae bacterium]|nr:OmpA family protein [Candidatus Competibacteraceae bacterium]
MAINLLETLKAQFGDDLMRSLGDLTGEQPSLIRAATERAGEATLAGLIQRGSTPDGAATLANVLDDARFDDSVSANLAASARGAGSPASLIDQGKALLGSLFGDRTDGLARWVSSSSGVGQNSALSLMSLLAPAVLSLIKRQFGGNPDASGLRGLLDGQRGFLEKSAPAGLLPALGWQSWTPAAARAPEPDAVQPRRAVIAEPAERERSGFPWYWILLLLGLLLLGFLLMRGCDRADTAATRAPAASTAPAAPRQDVMVATAQPVDLVLRDNSKLRVMPGSIEHRLVTFIEDASKVPDQTTWFTFDGLEFETGSSNLKASSVERLKQIAAILKAYPAVNIKIGGYTDNVGDPQTNLKISGERAKATLQTLVSMGIGANRMEAEGYGEQHPVADNATDQGRQKNRRVDIRVTAK